MKDDGYVPFECPKAFDGYDELAQDAEERINGSKGKARSKEKSKSDENSKSVQLSVGEARRMRDNNLLACLLHMLPEGYRNAQYRITRTNSKKIAGFTDCAVEFKYTNESGTYIDKFQVQCVGRSVLPNKINV